MLATSTQPAFQNEIEDYEEDDEGPKIINLNPISTLKRVCSIINTVLAAANSKEDERRELSFRMGVPGKKTGALLQILIQSISPSLQHNASEETLVGLFVLIVFSGLVACSSLEETAASSDAPTPTSSDNLLAALRVCIDKLVAHFALAAAASATATDETVITDPAGSNYDANELNQSMCIAAESALDHMRRLSSSSSGSPYYPFISVDAGWFIPDGYCADLITKGSVTWCEDDHADVFELELYTQLHTLRLCVLETETELDELDDAFAWVVPKINALPMLRELHLCRTEDEAFPSLSFPDLTLPHLNRLVISNGYILDSFQSLACFPKLQQLAVTLPEDVGNVSYKLHDLSCLSSLGELQLSKFQAMDWQCIHTLTALTSLKLQQLADYHSDFAARGEEGGGGLLKLAILPKAPMPRLRELDLVFSMQFFDNESENAHICDGVIDWILRNSATTFPGIEKMRLGVLEFPASLDPEGFSIYQAADLMDDRVHDVLTNTPKLKYLSIKQARVKDEEELDEEIHSGDTGSAWEEELAIRSGASRSVKWKREANFIMIDGSRSIMSAHFMYTRK